MRVKGLMKFLIGSPAAVAALVLAIFAGAGFLIVIRGPIGPPAVPSGTRAPATRGPRSTRTRPSASTTVLANTAAGALEVLTSPDGSTTPAEIRAEIDAITTGPAGRRAAAQLLDGQLALAQKLARHAPDAVLEMIPVGYAIDRTGGNHASIRLWGVVLAGDAALGVTCAWATARLEMARIDGTWRVAGMAPLVSGPAPRMGPPAAIAPGVIAAAIAGLTPLMP
jgi:hypothetical protein